MTGILRNTRMTRMYFHVAVDVNWFELLVKMKWIREKNGVHYAVKQIVPRLS